MLVSINTGARKTETQSFNTDIVVQKRFDRVILDAKDYNNDERKVRIVLDIDTLKAILARVDAATDEKFYHLDGSPRQY